MVQFSRAPVVAVLGPTNTGKTHLAVERLCAHSSGMMGFPLRLLAREIYDRVVAVKGPSKVALITGEEKIEPPGARWYLCTAESMPLTRDFAFVALDEAQLGADTDRGHIFTDRILRARGRDETMILGSAALAPMVNALLPEAQIISRPRFSTLSYAGAKKLSRLPRRSAIVAFSVEEVYAVAEMLRRLRGGAAVVMGALSPSTRNAQVQMFMNGDVDYLVATDAIGMGLNLDVTHVAFASLRKFDGSRTRRLTTSEIAQIAGRAGRHQRDGTFGTLGGEDGASVFRAEEIAAIEAHEFPRIDQLYWREGNPPMDSLDALIEGLEARPGRPELKPAPQAIDLMVLKAMADDKAVRDQVRSSAQLHRLWDLCGLPDFQKLGLDHHVRMLSRLWRFRCEGSGHIRRDWFAQAIAHLDTVQGDVDTLSGRIAAARTWSYIAHRPDWLADPAEMAERTRALEEKLSDALHAALMQRFVDRRTSVLLRDIGRKNEHLPVDVNADGVVQVNGETLGHLQGFRFQVDPEARGGDRKLLLAAAERRLGKMLIVQAEELIAAPDRDFVLIADPGTAPYLAWKEAQVAELRAGARLLAPDIRVEKAISALGQDIANRVAGRLHTWMIAQQERHLAPLLKIVEQSTQADTPPEVRALFIQLADASGIIARNALDNALNRLDKEQRQIVRRAGFTIGVLDIFHHALLKPGAARWRLALTAVKRGKPMLPLPQAGAVLLTLNGRDEQMGAARAGFRGFGDTQIRIDMIERIARGGHEAIAKNERYDANSPFIVSLGLSEQLFNQVMRSAGFRAVAPAVPLTSVHADVRRTDESTDSASTSERPASLPIDGPFEGSKQDPKDVSVSADAPAPHKPKEISKSPPAISSSSSSDASDTDTQGQADAGAPDDVPATNLGGVTGANWTFRGRARSRVRHVSGNSERGDARRTRVRGPQGSESGAAKEKSKDTQRRASPIASKKAPSRPKKDHSHYHREKARPAGGGAFAELAALLGRDD